VFSWIIDLLFFMDWVLTAFVYGFYENGNVVVDMGKIRARYFGQPWGRVACDILAVLPLDLLALISPVGLHMIPILRLSKILQINRAWYCHAYPYQP
jgi:hypothetical protein